MTEIDDVRDGGVSRRTMLKRSALVGGSLVWVTPAVQSISASAFAQTTDGSPKPVQGVGPSNVVILVQCGGLYYTAKIDRDDAEFVCGKDALPPNAPFDNTTARQVWENHISGKTPDPSAVCPVDVRATSLGPNAASCFRITGSCQIVDWIVFDGALGPSKYRLMGQAFPAGWVVPAPGPVAGDVCFSKPA